MHKPLELGVLLLSVLTALVLLHPIQPCQAGPLDEWEILYSQPTPNPIRDSIFTNNMWLAVGDVGSVLVSHDNGDGWTRLDSGVTNVNSDFKGVAYGNGLYVAVGTEGLAATSPDGTNWTIHPTGAGPLQDFNAVAFGNGRFVAVGRGFSDLTNTVATSLDGTNWTFQSAAVLYQLSDVAYLGGMFVAVGGYKDFAGFGTVMTSTDGVSWTAGLTNATRDLGGVTHGNGMFVAVGDRRTVYSADGVNWSEVFNPSALYMRRVAYGNGVFTAVGATPGTGVQSYYYTSTDGTNWFSHTGSLATDRVRFANNRFVAVGSPAPQFIGYRGTVTVSEDGTNWSQRSYAISANGGPGPTVLCESIAGGNGIFIVTHSTDSLLFSTDPYKLWVNQFGSVTAPTALAFEGGNFYAADESSGYQIYAATNAYDWSAVAFPFARVNSLEGLGDGILGACDGGYVIESPDGSTWNDIYTGVTENLHDAARGGGVYVAVGAGGQVVSSTNLVDWSAQLVGGGVGLNGAAHSNGVFVVVGEGGTILSSTNGSDWQTAASLSSNVLHEVRYCFGQFHAFGDGGTWLTSSNGQSWTKHEPLSESSLRASALVDGLMLVTGLDGVLLSTTDGVNWLRRSFDQDYDGVHWEMIYHNGRLITANEGGISESKSGLGWQFQMTPGSAYGIAAHDDTIVRVGYGDTLFSSGITVSFNDGQSWLSTNFSNMGALNGVTYGDGLFVAVGEDNFFTSESPIFTSPDALNWTLRSSGTSETFARVAHGNNMYVATLENLPQVVTSPDGVTWTVRETSVPGGFDGVAFLDNEFVAVGTRVATSTDGTNWTDKGDPGASLIAITRAMGTYVAVGNNGAILSSTNLMNWTHHWSGTRQILKGVAFVNDRFVVTGYGGTVILSGYLSSSPASILASPTNLELEWGGSGTLSVIAEGRFPLSYQWFKDGMAISGATSDTLEILDGGQLGAGTYYVVVANEFGSEQSALATVTVNAPVILLQMLPPDEFNEFPTLVIEGPVDQLYEIQYTEKLGSEASWQYGDQFYLSTSPEYFTEPTYLGYSNAFFRALLMPSF